ncbi:stemmadenine O-acetyltransferase-like [Impatiens glandulifera]|uniref:stemmadenine O-acetyltransferase-like n=1 Tax=Impatiens glandulifera TaxID=253017 RepID=UPI001FB07D4F|nr:stemmadenine O-acetyltransferase-like [Impatiens glandulifera]
MEVVVKSSEAIKPSSPTPSHLGRHYRSFIDQTNPKLFMPTIYYYPPPPPNNMNNDPIAANAERIDSLKRSLADVLTSFYPFAGRATDPSFIDCNDSGVVFTQAVVIDHRCITDVIAEKNAQQLSPLLPFSTEITGAGVHDDERLLGVQANIFKCGGLALGVSWSHNICDAFCFINFINSWARLARGEEITPPTTISASIFPPLDNLSMFGTNNNSSSSDINDIDETNKNRANEENNKNEGRKVVVTTKVFRFSGASISSLKDKYSEQGRPELIPTSAEALSTFIWTRFYESRKKQSRRYFITQMVNLRNKADPGLKLDSCIGNVCQFVVVHPDLELVDGSSGYGIVRRMRAAIRKFDVEYLKKLEKGDASLFFEGLVDPFEEGTSMFMFSCMNRFPYYDADFGWGRPIWVSYGHFDFSNFAFMIPTESGDGVDVWLNMNEDDMKELQLDQQFINTLLLS